MLADATNRKQTTYEQMKNTLERGGGECKTNQLKVTAKKKKTHQFHPLFRIFEPRLLADRTQQMSPASARLTKNKSTKTQGSG